MPICASASPRVGRKASTWNHDHRPHQHAGRPIRITRATHGEGVPEGWTIAIVFGETELQLKETLVAAGLTGPDTEFKIDPRLK